MSVKVKEILLPKLALDNNIELKALKQLHILETQNGPVFESQ
jgi:hypothetical protein